MCDEQVLPSVNLKQSKGDYTMDVDGNALRDLVYSEAIGYNHDVLINSCDSKLYDRFL